MPASRGMRQVRVVLVLAWIERLEVARAWTEFEVEYP